MKKPEKSQPVSTIEARHEKAVVLINKEKWDEAATLLAGIIREKPDHVPSIERLAYVAKQLGNLEGAINMFRAVIELRPIYAIGYTNLAITLKEAGRIEEARDVLLKAHQIDSKDYETTVYLGNMYLELGDKEKAKEFYLKVYEQTGNIFLLYMYLIQQHKFTSEEDPYLKELRKQEKNLQNLGNAESINLHYMISKALRDLKQYDESFKYLKKGSDLKRASYEDYDVENHLNLLKYAEQFYTKEVVEQRAKQGSPSTAPLFIVGMPRSGSTLIDQILFSHKDVLSIGESSVLSGMMREYTRAEAANRKPPFSHTNPKALNLNTIRKKYLDYISPHASKAKYVIDKTLINYAWIGMIKSLFPNAKIIHTVRNPLDCCLSCYSFTFGKDAQLYSYDLTELGKVYRGYRDLMNHWHKEFPGTILDVVYEDVIEDFEPQVRRILDYLGLPWDENCVKFYESERHVRTASLTQVRQPIYKSSAGKWKDYARHLGPLLEAMGPYAPEEALKMLENT